MLTVTKPELRTAQLDCTFKFACKSLHVQLGPSNFRMQELTCGVLLTSMLSAIGNAQGFSVGVLAAEGLLSQRAKWLLYNGCIEAPITINMLLDATSAAGL